MASLDREYEAKLDSYYCNTRGSPKTYKSAQRAALQLATQTMWPKYKELTTPHDQGPALAYCNLRMKVLTPKVITYKMMTGAQAWLAKHVSE